MATLQAQLVLSLVDRVTAPARAVAGSVQDLQQRAQANARQMNAMRGQMLDAVAAAWALQKALSAPIEAAMAFESAMADINKVVDFESPEEFRQMSRDILDMSKRIPMAATGIADIVAAAGQAGMAGAELLAFAEMAAKVGVAFDITGDEAGESLAKIKTALGLSVGQVSDLADAINHLSNTSASSAPDVLDFMRSVGATGKQYGFSAEQTAAIGSAMIAAGADANVAATSFRNMGRALASGASASKRQVEAYKQLGLNASDVAKRFNEDAVGTMDDVIKRIRALPKHLQASAISDLFGDEARALMPLIENADLLEKTLASVAQQSEFLGSSQKEFEVRAKTAANAVQLFKNQMTALSISIGAALLPIIVEMTGALGPLIGALSDLATRHAGVTAAVVSLVAGLVGLRIATLAARWAFLFLKGGVLDVGIAAAQGANKVVAASKKMRLAIVGATMLSSVGGAGIFTTLIASVTSATGSILAAASGIGAALAAVTAPVWITVAAIVAAGIAIGLAFYNFWEPISNFVSGFASGISNALSPALEAFGSFVTEITTLAGSWAKDALIDIGSMLGIDPAVIEAAIERAQQAISSVGSAIASAVRAIPAQIGNWFADIFTVNDYSAQAEAEFRSMGERAAQALIGVFTYVPGKIVQAIGSIDITSAFVDPVSKIIGWFAGLGSRILEAIGSIDIANLIKWPTPPAWLSRLWNSGGNASPDNGVKAIDGARAAGGSIVGGRTYLVGEHGPELVTPSRAGYVHDAQATEAMGRGSGLASASPTGARGNAASRTVQMGGVTIHVHQQPGESGEALASRINEALGRLVQDSLDGGQFDQGYAVA